MNPRASTRVFALLGNPVAHSLSPAMHNAAFHAMSIDAVYVALRCDDARLAPLIISLAAAGGGGNVTIPHKRSAAAVSGIRSDIVKATESANVFVGDAASLRLENTDVAGVAAVVRSVAPESRRWLVAGTGGSAHAVAIAARQCGASVAIKSRDPRRAAAFSTWAASVGAAIVDDRECDVMINATPLGMSSADPLPPLVAGPSIVAAVDLVYTRAGDTPWIAESRRRGIAVANGHEMLVAQGAAAWEHWFPGVVPPVGVMRAALRST